MPDDVERDSGPITTDDLFRTLADPTRRRILDLLADLGTQTVGELAAHFPNLVASGISKHLMALRAKGLATATRQGRNQLYAIDADALSQVLGTVVGPVRELLGRGAHPPAGGGREAARRGRRIGVS